ncbi:MAG: 6-bladed beta-propeller [Planctomycetota bacterium]|jgi:DNA-binding beta-propeller fold protein YncE
MRYVLFTRNASSVALCFLLPALLLDVGCGRPGGQIFPPLQPPRVWPEPPEKPRIKYVGMISTEEDLKRGISWTQGLGELFFGRKEIGVLRSPYAVAIDESQRLFVADTSGGVIHVFNLTTRDYYQFDGIDEGRTLIMPVALAIAGGNIFVVDSVLRSVCVFDKEGKFRFSFGGDLLKRPSGIACWEEGGKIYVSDTAGHIVVVFDTQGRFVREIGSRGAEEGRFNFPTHLWVDKNGKLYVSDTLNYRIQIFSLDGRFLKMFGEHGDRPGYFAHPCGLATDSLGHIYVTDRQFENIQVFDNTGEVLLAWGEEGSEPGEFWLPGGVYIDDHNRIYVADSFNKRVQVFELMGANGS